MKRVIMFALVPYQMMSARSAATTVTRIEEAMPVPA
jgi:hypothetical protein